MTHLLIEVFVSGFLITYRPRKILLHLCQPVVDYMHSMYFYSGFHRGIQSLEVKLPLFSLSFERQAATLGEVGCSPWPRERAVWINTVP